jgi:hypothetical protein
MAIATWGGTHTETKHHPFELEPGELLSMSAEGLANPFDSDSLGLKKPEPETVKWDNMEPYESGIDYINTVRRGTISISRRDIELDEDANETGFANEAAMKKLFKQ